MATTLLRFVFLSACIIAYVSSQGSESGSPSLADILTTVASPPNEALIAIFTPQIAVSQTAIGIRYALLIALGRYEVVAACDSIALSFFGTKDYIPEKFCTDRDANAIVKSLVGFRVIQSEFPAEARSYGAFLSKNGLNIASTSTDRNTLEGWANIIAARLIKYFSSDGWNSKGDATRMNFRQGFSDSTGYQPQNLANLSPPRRPLRWQPLTSEKDGRGDFATQVHVVPQLGSSAKPLVLSPADLNAARVPCPYEQRNSRKLSVADENNLRMWTSTVLKANAGLTNQQIGETFWWENKFLSVGLLPIVYAEALKLDPKQTETIRTGTLIAQLEAVLLAWREKVRHDLVRPTTVIRNLLRGKMVKAFRGFGKGVGLVKAEEWESLVAVQPHSEFPSATAAICEATSEILRVGLRTYLGNNVSIPPFESKVPAGLVPKLSPDISFTVKFNSLEEASARCMNSRILAGVHFPPAVQAGQEIGKIAGRKTFEHMNSLFNGVVPENCQRCVKA